MKWINNRTIGKTAGVLLAGLVSTSAFAEYPERPIKMVIPYGAGGATDISARTIAESLGVA
ncbi:MAG: ABC transporter substrate-binding protein, partial [Burkholderiaceae bacterium]